MILDRLPPLLRHAAFWLCVLVVLVLSLLPVGIPLPSTGWDKANHALAFGAMALLGRWAYPRNTAAILLGLLVYGGLIEALQSLTATRTADWHDLLADSIGLALAWTLMRLTVRPARRPS